MAALKDTSGRVYKLETWKSNQQREERHYFIDIPGAGYQQSPYLFGYNPSFVSPAKVEAILKILGIEHGD